MSSQGGLGPKSLHGNRFYKGHRDIMLRKKPHMASKIIEIFHFSGNVFKKPRYVNKIYILIKKKPPFP
jgi:hypothetical protein